MGRAQNKECKIIFDELKYGNRYILKVLTKYLTVDNFK